MGGPVKRREYDNAGRRASSDDRRRRIVEAARELVATRGYRATTVAEVARRSGVHVDTVYALVGRKPALLRELIEQAISGTDHAVAPDERDYVRALRAEPDPARKLAIYARASCAIQGRMAPLFLALRDAATTEPEAEEAWREIDARRARNMRALVADLVGEAGAGGVLRPGLTVDAAADVVWAMASAEAYALFTVERGWSPEAYADWLGDAWARLLLA